MSLSDQHRTAYRNGRFVQAEDEKVTYRSRGVLYLSGVSKRRLHLPIDTGRKVLVENGGAAENYGRCEWKT